MSIGKWGEDIAVSFLKKKGYKITERNYRSSFGEIDIIALHKGKLIFIEVKTRRTDEYGEPFEAIDSRKIERIRNSALMYLRSLDKELPVRFDVVSITVGDDSHEVRHIDDAF
ncbi:MAG: YraN family protein [Nitrospirota bacterium]|nr:MAG: YraN family protein [Nitrospirota bacterium]